jgi:hypothetical protein
MQVYAMKKKAQIATVLLSQGPQFEQRIGSGCSSKTDFMRCALAKHLKSIKARIQAGK